MTAERPAGQVVRRTALGAAGGRPLRRRNAAGPAGRCTRQEPGQVKKSMGCGRAANAKKPRNSAGKCKPRLDKGERSPYNIFVSVQGRGQCALLPYVMATPKSAAGISPKKRREAP
ncbi:MAG TPA: hypothetical protein DCP22_07520 [Ruminococcaceae bacterium]|nr:hypothetical protein [Oscillospiraceae bacterium]